MADPYEIAREVLSRVRTQYVGRVPTDSEVLAEALLAQRAVVEAAVALERAEFAIMDWASDPAAFEERRHAARQATCKAVRAYLAAKEQK